VTFWIYNYGQPIALAEPKLIPPDGMSSVQAIKGSRAVEGENQHFTHTTDLPLETKGLAQSQESYYQTPNYQQSNQSQRHPVFRVEDVMSHPVKTVNTQATVESVLQIFGLNSFRHFPVVDEKGELQGIISDRDIYRWVHMQADKLFKVANTPISELMQIKVLTCAPEQNIRAVAVMMLQYHAGSILVMSAQKSLMGIMTRSDILRLIVKNEPFDFWS